jgi:pimeloyl-ACP methyl ester carboxylesterase
MSGLRVGLLLFALQVAEPKFLNLSEGRVHYLEAGAGEPVILIHGWAAWSGSFAELISYLSKDFWILAPDLKGHGQSAKPGTGDYSIAAQVRWVKELMDSLKIGSTTLVGHSLGGQVAAQLALNYPERVRKLVLIAPIGIKETARIPWLLRVIKHFPLDEVVVSLINPSLIRYYLERFGCFDPRRLKPEIIAQLFELNFGTEQDRQAILEVTRQGLFKEFLNQRLPRIEQPVLIVWGSRDQLVRPANARIFKELLPNPRVLMLDRCGHMVPNEMPVELARGIMKFLFE